MIYTVTLNPSIDCYMTLDALKQGATNRAGSEHIRYGGKGINVSIVLKELGVANTALGFIAGSNGIAIREGLKERIDTDFIMLDNGNSRINLKIRTAEGETEVNGIGPVIDDNALKRLFERLDKLTGEDTVILSGSVPQGLSETIYADMADKITSNGASFVCDSTGKLLLNTLKFGPEVIKPNVDELGDFFEKKIDPMDMDEIYSCALKLKGMGAKEVIVSLGKDGAVILDDKNAFTMFSAYKGEVKSSVCAGDSLLAGFIAGKKKGLSSADALELGVAAGSACAFSYDLPTLEEINNLLGKA